MSPHQWVQTRSMLSSGLPVQRCGVMLLDDMISALDPPTSAWVVSRGLLGSLAAGATKVRHGKTRQDKRLHLLQPAWLIRCLIHRHGAPVRDHDLWQ